MTRISSVDELSLPSLVISGPGCVIDIIDENSMKSGWNIFMMNYLALKAHGKNIIRVIDANLLRYCLSDPAPLCEPSLFRKILSYIHGRDRIDVSWNIDEVVEVSLIDIKREILGDIAGNYDYYIESSECKSDLLAEARQALEGEDDFLGIIRVLRNL